MENPAGHPNALHLTQHQQQEGHPIDQFSSPSSLSSSSQPSTSQQSPQNSTTNHDHSYFQWIQFSKSYRQVTQHNSYLKTELNSLQQQYEEIKQQNKTIAANHDLLIDENGTLSAKILLLQQNIVKLIENGRKKKGRAAVVIVDGEDSSECPETIQSLKEELKISNEKVDLLTSEKEQYISENRENRVCKLEEKLKQAEDELQRREDNIDNLHSEYEKVKLNCNSELEQLKHKYESELLRQANTAALDQNHKMMNEQHQNRLREDVKKLQHREEVQKLQSEIELLKKNEKEMAELKTQVHIQSKLISESVNNEKRANAVVKVLKAQVENLKSENKSLSCQRECSLNEAHHLQAETKSLGTQTELGDLEAKIKGLEEKVNETNKKLESQTTKGDKQVAQVQLLQKQLLKRDIDNTKLQRELDEKETAMAYQKDNGTRLAEENCKLEKSLQKFKSEIIQHQNKIECLSEEKTKLEHELELKSSSEQNLKDLYHRSALKMQNSSEEIQVLKSKVDLLEKRLVEKQEMIQTQQIELQNNDVQRADDLCKQLQAHKASQERRSSDQSQHKVQEVITITSDDDDEDDMGPLAAKMPRWNN